MSGKVANIFKNAEDDPHEKPRDEYLTGLRGVLAVQSFVWLYFQTFIPALVSGHNAGPEYQHLLRDILSPLLWDGSLISSGFILLSLRTVGSTFLRAPSAATYAGALVRRTVRIIALIFVASGIGSLIFSLVKTSYIDAFKDQLPNATITKPTKPYNALAVFNSIFNLFYLTDDFFTQAANSFWPSQTLWVSSVAYYESFTVYIMMVILPYTRVEWHVQMLAFFALGSFWYESWGWYAATGLLLADMSANPLMKALVQRGLPISQRVRCPA